MKNLDTKNNRFFFSRSLVRVFSLAICFVSFANNTPNGFVPVSASVALQKLKDGNESYRSLRQKLAGLGEEDRVRLVSEQHPHTIVVACSDSRVPPEIVFDQRLGDLFVVRTAGEALDKIALGSVEYALEHLHSKLLIVLGHESCGAVNAVLKSTESSGSVNLDALIEKLRPNLLGVERSPTLLSESSANAKAIAKQLADPNVSKVTAKHFRDHNLEIRSAIYHLSSGKVEFHQPVTIEL